MNYNEWEQSRRRTTPNLDTSELAAQFKPFFHGPRVRVRTEWEDGYYERTGTVSVTTGWRPVFILMHRSSDHGSSDVLGPTDTVVAVQYGRRGYVPYTQPTT